METLYSVIEIKTMETGGNKTNELRMLLNLDIVAIFK